MKMMKILAFAFLFAVVAAEFAPLLHTENKNVISGSYIVILKDGLEVLDRDSHVIALQERITTNNDTESKVGFKYNIGSFIGFSAKLSKTLLQEQLAHSNVKYIEADQVMSVNYKQNLRVPEAIVTQSGATWGIARVSKRDLPYGTDYLYNSNAGTDVDVYVLDTGILTTHNEFGGRATAVYNAITGEPNTDLSGHGTHCAGTVGGATYGIAKNVQLKSVKVLSQTGSGTSAEVISGVNYVTNNKSSSRNSVASMSVGGEASQALDEAVTASITSGVPFVVAAGNSNVNACNYSPARVAEAITVGATSRTDARSTFSNFGSCLDIFAPGTSITSAWIGDNSAINTISGTSMAAPHVAGAIALAWSQSYSSTATEIRDAVLSAGTTGKVTNTRTSPNVLLFTNPAA